MHLPGRLKTTTLGDLLGALHLLFCFVDEQQVGGATGEEHSDRGGDQTDGRERGAALVAPALACDFNKTSAQNDQPMAQSQQTTPDAPQTAQSQPAADTGSN